MSDELYRLRWDSSKQVVNLSNAFEAFRNDEQLFDVSLVCSSGNGGGSTLRAHKVVLAAYSSVFKDMFIRLSDKKDPIVFLKGISQDNLSSILDFMYNGSVDIPKSMINEFFSDAQELKIKGLKGDNNEETRNKKPVGKSYESKINESIRSKQRVKREEESELNLEYKSQDMSDLNTWAEEMAGGSLKRARRMPSKIGLKTELDEDKSVFYASETGFNEDPLDRSYSAPERKPNNQPQNYISSYSNEDRARIEATFEKTDKWSGSESKRRSVYQCRLCSKELRSDRRLKHLKSTHPE